MPNDQQLRAYRPNPTALRLVITTSCWAVYVSPAATIQDVAIVMNGLACELRAKAGTLATGFFLRPANPKAKPPTHEEFAAVLERGFSPGGRIPAFTLRAFAH